MKAKELIEKLKMVSPESEIHLETDTQDLYGLESIIFDLMDNTVTLSPFSTITPKEEIK